MAQATTNQVINSAAAASGQVGQDCTHASLWDASTGGNLLWQGAISTNPDALQLGGGFSIAAGALLLIQNPGTGETQEMARRALRGKIAGGVYVQYHRGAPGAAGTSNIIAIARTYATAGAFTVT